MAKTIPTFYTRRDNAELLMKNKNSTNLICNLQHANSLYVYLALNNPQDHSIRLQ